MTINEVRARWDLEPLDTKAADMILDQTYINAVQQQEAQEEEAQDEEAQGEGGEDGFDFDIDKFLAGDEEETPEEAPEEAQDEEAQDEDMEKSMFRTVRVEVL